MPIVTVIAMLAQYGPAILPLVQQVVAWTEGGKTTVTSADINLLVELGRKSSADYLAAAGGAPVAAPAAPVAPKA